METIKQETENFDEQQSMKLIRQMIDVSQRKLNNNGFLFLVWGYAMTFSCLANYLKQVLFLSNSMHVVLQWLNPLLPLLALAYTIFYVVKQRKKASTYIGVSLRYLWIAFFISLVFTNLVIYNVQQEVDFALQHPIFMVITAFAVVLTGIILRYNLVVIGGIIFGAFALVASNLALRDQLLLDSIAWFLSIAAPGHIMYFRREK